MAGARGLIGLVVAAVALVAVSGATAAPPAHLRPVPGQTAALLAVKKAVSAGRLTSAVARTDRGVIAQAVHLVRVLPDSRGKHIEVALEQVGALGGGLTSPRALALFGQLQANDSYFARHGVPAGGLDITDADGVVYRYFAGRCFEFHPLAEFGALNARVAAKDVAGTERLANALMARAVTRPGGGLAWEYYFPFGGGRAPWTSGMAQSVAAQAFARAAALVLDDSAAFTQEATSAFKEVPKLTTTVAAGPWIRLYSFSSLAVLNAQLQSVLSLQTYATATGDSTAATLASQMEQSAAASVSRFDTGYWTYYSLGGAPTPLSYQKFIVQLLQKLAPQDPRFAEAAAQFAAYLKQPPAFKLANTSPGAMRFWLSKPSLVTVSTPSGLGRSLRLNLLAGWHTLTWTNPKRAGFYAVHVTAVDFAGNRASFNALPVVRASANTSSGSSGGSGAGATTPVPSQFAVGIGVDDPAQGAQAASLGLSLVRRTVEWQSGQSAPDPATVQSLQGLPSGTGLVVDLDASDLPTGDAGRAALGAYAASLAQQTPALRYLVLTPAPERSNAAGYADALAAIRTGVRSVKTDVGVGPFLDGSTTNPQLTTTAVAHELAQDNSAPDLVAFIPAPVPAAGAWAVGDLASLESAVAQGLGTKAPPVLLDAVPSSTAVVAPAAQASDYASAIEAASCLPDVSGVLLDRLDDGTTSETTSGLYDAAGQAKPSAAAVKQAVQTVARGGVVCPGLAAPVAPTTLTFPTQLSSSSAISVTLGCSRDCLYLVTLDRANGRPVVARRGSLDGGAAPQTITLPKGKLSGGSYRLDLRLVSRVDPGVVDRVRSGLLNVG